MARKFQVKDWVICTECNKEFQITASQQLSIGYVYFSEDGQQCKHDAEWSGVHEHLLKPVTDFREGDTVVIYDCDDERMIGVEGIVKSNDGDDLWAIWNDTKNSEMIDCDKVKLVKRGCGAVLPNTLLKIEIEKMDEDTTIQELNDLINKIKEKMWVELIIKTRSGNDGIISLRTYTKNTQNAHNTKISQDFDYSANDEGCDKLRAVKEALKVLLKNSPHQDRKQITDKLKILETKLHSRKKWQQTLEKEIEELKKELK